MKLIYENENHGKLFLSDGEKIDISVLSNKSIIQVECLNKTLHFNELLKKGNTEKKTTKNEKNIKKRK